MKSSDPLLLADGNLHCGMYPAGKVAISRHLVTPRVPPMWPYCQQTNWERWRSLKWRIADLLTSIHPKMSASNLLGLQGPQQTPAMMRILTRIELISVAWCNSNSINRKSQSQQNCQRCLHCFWVCEWMNDLILSHGVTWTENLVLRQGRCFKGGLGRLLSICLIETTKLGLTK